MSDDLTEQLEQLKYQVQWLQAALNAGGSSITARAADVDFLQAKFQDMELEWKSMSHRLETLNQDITQSIQQQIQTAAQQRGVRSLDFLSYTKFITTILTQAIEQIRQKTLEDVKGVFSTELLQNVQQRLGHIEKTLLQYLGTHRFAEVSEVFFQDQLRTLESRVQLIEKEATTREELTEALQKFSGPNEVPSFPQVRWVTLRDLQGTEQRITQTTSSNFLTQQQQISTLTERTARLEKRLDGIWNTFKNINSFQAEYLAFQASMSTMIHQQQEISYFQTQWKEHQMRDFIETANDLRRKTYAFEEQKIEWQIVLGQIRDLTQWKAEAEAKLTHLASRPLTVAKPPSIYDMIPKPLPSSLPPLVSLGTKKSFSELRKCFYTAVYGTDFHQMDIRVPTSKISGWDYICFTNFPQLPACSPWKDISHPLVAGKDPVLEIKNIKWKSHQFLKDYDVVVWLDAYMAPDPTKALQWERWIQTMMDRHYSIVHRPHAQRDCIWDECSAVIQGRRAKPEDVKKIQDRLAVEDMPKHWGLFDTNIMIRFHNEPEVQSIGDQMIQLMQHTTRRDQLAVTYVYWKRDFRAYAPLPLGLIVLTNGIHKRQPAF